jgi:hypothetical protein
MAYFLYFLIGLFVFIEVIYFIEVGLLTLIVTRKTNGVVTWDKTNEQWHIVFGQQTTSNKLDMVVFKGNLQVVLWKSMKFKGVFYGKGF